jgi:excinuclease ABC subunit C
MMSEMLRRRFAVRGDTGAKWSSMPDLVLIDGGKGHLHAASSALREVQAADTPIISLAKENEDVFRLGLPAAVPITKSSPELHLLQRIRDEAHRFAVTYHRNIRAKKSRESALDSLPGIGPARKKALVKRFGSVRNLKEASIEDLSSVKGITPELARGILDLLA